MKKFCAKFFGNFVAKHLQNDLSNSVLHLLCCIQSCFNRRHSIIHGFQHISYSGHFSVLLDWINKKKPAFAGFPF